MPTAIILGLPKGQADRIKGALKATGKDWQLGWSVHFTPPTGANHQIREADIRVALTSAEKSKESIHIFAITNQGGNRKQEISAQFSQYFRFRWLPGQWLALPYPSPAEFIDKVNETLIEEGLWREVIQPANISSCLLLPSIAFATKKSDLWDLAKRYGDGTTAGCERRKISFEREHLKSRTSEHHSKDYLWKDDDQRIFDHTGPQHGEPPPLRRWKYSFLIPTGFHFDVSHANDQKFSVKGVLRTEAVKQGKYTNIDCHGYFRD